MPLQLTGPFLTSFFPLSCFVNQERAEEWEGCEGLDLHLEAQRRADQQGARASWQVAVRTRSRTEAKWEFSDWSSTFTWSGLSLGLNSLGGFHPDQWRLVWTCLDLVLVWSGPGLGWCRLDYNTVL